MKSPPRILFVCHSASRNGATILLLHLLQWLRDHTDYQLEVLMCGTGELIDEFRSVCKTRVWRNPSAVLSAFPRSWQNAWGPGFVSQYLGWRLMGLYYDLVYVNTSAVSSYVPLLAKHSRSVLWHIHELEYVLRLSIGSARINSLFPLATRFISVSQAVSDALVNLFKVPSEKLDLVNGFIPASRLTAEDALSRRQQIRHQLGWSGDDFVVGGCGALGWRKGTDVFLQVARHAIATKGNDRTHFLWVGGETAGDEALRFDHDIRSFGMVGRCHLIPSTAQVMDYYYAMDVFALTSREDPFPLVMLEAGTCNLPVVCFAGTGGGPEFVADDAGLIAPYLDVEALAAHIETLRDDPQLRSKYGAAAAEKVQRNHLIESQGPKLLASIQRCLPVQLDISIPVKEVSKS